MQPRRNQTPIAFRSDRAAARLRELTRGGRSQAEVIEEALDNMPTPVVPASAKAMRRAEIEQIIGRLSKSGLPDMKAFDAREYDEAGNPR